ncbi:MAG: pyruvate:ferredoxin (flavodoxin) oxidoreductase [Candidatus Hatepunaea meridiana]|nr:pyruvate:ferredoxin (flavodoxin) oxidoreductase [Candidatus Hatepunaea meridiana]
MKKHTVTIDGNEAAAYVAHHVNEVIAIYPITPSSNMGEWADQWTAEGKTNIWGALPEVIEMQSEGGASAAVHGALQTGALTTTFTASQGLLLMIPSMFKIAGELTSTCFHVSARTIATHALSIFGDHSDIMAVRSTGWGLLSSGSIQEVMDLALIGSAATLETRIPFIHFFDGFRSSHEVQKIEPLSEDQMKAMINDELVYEHHRRGMRPEKPELRGSSQNPDVFFQGRERINPYYTAAPDKVQKVMDQFYKVVGRRYNLFDYVGHPEAERIVILMGSGVEAAHEAIEYLANQGEKVGAIKVRLFRPFSVKHFIEALPETVKSIAVLDRTKEPGAQGEPMYKDIVTALAETVADGGKFKLLPTITGGRYGLSSKEFTPAMVKGVLDELKKDNPKRRFTIGIEDDVTHLSLPYDHEFSVESDSVFRGLFYGLGADGTVGANKNSIKIIGEDTDNFAQGYFVYDSKKSGAVTVSHLRFGPDPIRSTYLINKANFIACHQTIFLERYDMLSEAVEGATFLLNTYVPPEKAWDTLPRSAQRQIIDKKMKFYVIDAYKVGRETGMGERVNTIMQTCFFAISNILPREEAIEQIKKSIKKTYSAKGEKVVQMNFNAVDQSVANLHEVAIPDKVTSPFEIPPQMPAEAPEYMRNVLGTIMSYKGDTLPVSAFPVDGIFPVASTQYEKRNIALEIPVWDENLCTQCGKCVFVCPHAAIRQKVYPPELLSDAPSTFKSADYKAKDFKGNKYTLQVAPEDCTGCVLCVEVCPVKDKKNPDHKAINMAPQPPLREPERENFKFFLDIPEVDRAKLKIKTVKGSQFLRPLFEFSGACSGCGETPYVKLVSQLFGDRCIIGNATGCSSIYGGNLPTTPWCMNNDGRGPVWNNSLFEDTAEFSLGLRLTIDQHYNFSLDLMNRLRDEIGGELIDAIRDCKQLDEGEINDQRIRVASLKEIIKGIDRWEARHLLEISDSLVKKSIWGMGGDGWAYDIGYGGLDHVIATGRNVNLLVLDTGVYSNTGGQCSKATPMGAVAKFAASGKGNARKDLGMMAMNYGHVYVAQIAMGANDTQCVKAFIEAENYDGPSLIIAYSQCIAHGIDMSKGMEQQIKAVKSGVWPLYRYNPLLTLEGKNPLQLDSKPPSIPVKDFTYSETRFRMLTKFKPDRAEDLANLLQEDTNARWKFYEQLAKMDYSKDVVEKE